MKIIENQLQRQIQGEAMRSKVIAFLPHSIGPLYTLMIVGLLELLNRTYPWYSPSLALCFIGLAIGAVFAGLRSSLVSATIILIYGTTEFEVNPVRALQAVIAAYGCAIVYGYGRRLLIKWYQEAEYFRQKAVDNYNGNRAKMIEALDNMDTALNAVDMVDVKKFAQIARIKLADTLTLTSSWHEMARDKRLAIETLEQSAGYPWRADEKIKQIDFVVHEILKEVNRIRRAIEGTKVDSE
jgi:hypothetical protein